MEDKTGSSCTNPPPFKQYLSTTVGFCRLIIKLLQIIIKKRQHLLRMNTFTFL